MIEKIHIGSHLIGRDEPCFIIAEAGSNHNGSFEQAQRLIDAAVEAQADAVKFQLFRAHALYPKSAGNSDYLKLDKSIYDVISEMEMPYEWLPQLAEYCQERDIIFLSSAFDEESVDQLDPYVPVFKIASYEMTHLPLVRYIAGKMKPVIISTGTANLDEISETVEVFHETGNHELMLMQCTAAYPAPVESLNLRSITTMKEAFRVSVGLSDHSQEPLVGPLAAVALGADLIEKHFTLSNRLPGPDHVYALEPSDLSLMVKGIRDVELAMGSGEKLPHLVESELRSFARRSIFAVRDIAAGDVFSPKTVAVLRSGGLKPGLEPRYYETVIGKTATRNISADSGIQRDDLA